MTQTVAVRLDTAIVYVAGTVNGAAAEFELYQGNLWRTVVPRSETGAYDISLEAYDEAGNRSTYQTTLQYGFAAITNRRAGTFYNASDLNRVEHATRFLSDLLQEYGYAAGVLTKTDWVKTDIPTASQMERYRTNIKRLMDCYAVLPTTPPLPDSMEKLGYRGANAIEQILVDMHLLIENMTAARRYSGQFYSGE
ncbi:MAG: PF13754 domain-containing protein [Pseudoflavonifractor sp.]